MSAIETTGFEIQPLDETEARELTNKIRQNVGLLVVMVEKAFRGRAWEALGYGSWGDYCKAEFDGDYIKLPIPERRQMVATLTDAGMSTRAIGAAVGISDQTVRADIAQVREITHLTDPEEDLGAGDAGDREASASGDGAPPSPPAAVGPSPAPEPAEQDEQFICDYCAEGFSIPVWECRNCEHHMSIELEPNQCKYCYLPRDGEPATPEPPTKKVTGLDGKNYPAKPQQAPKRKALGDQANKAGWDLRKVVERLERLAADDRFTANKQQVAAQLASHLSYTVEVCQDLLDQLTNNKEK